MTFRILLIWILATFLVACAKTHVDPYKDFRHQTAVEIYHQGLRHLADESYHKAVDDFSASVGLYPFGRYAEPSQLDLIYAYYKDNQSEAAVAAADRYIRLYPLNPHIAYAYYMRGLVQFSQGLTWLQRSWGSDPAARDLSYKQQSYLAFSELVKRFPHSVYVPNAILHMQYIRNVLARHEWLIAQYYYDRGAYVAAANRASMIVKSYQGTPSVVPALALMVRAYRRLQLPDMASRTWRILQLSYPDAPQTKQLSKA